MNKTLEQEYIETEQARKERMEEAIVKAQKEGIPPSLVFAAIKEQILDVAAESVSESIAQTIEADPSSNKQSLFPVYTGHAKDKTESVLADTKTSIEKIYDIKLEMEDLDPLESETNKQIVLRSLLELHPECLITNEAGEKEIDEEKLNAVMEDMSSSLHLTNTSMKEERMRVLRKEILLLKYEGVGPVECYNRLKKEASETASMATESDLPVPPGMDKEGFLKMAWKHFLSELKEEIETVYDVKLKKKKRRRV